MDPIITTAVIGALASLLVAVLAMRTSERARRTTKQTDENATALEAWQSFVNPLREEVTRERAERARVEAELDEERKVSSALAKQNEALHIEVTRLREGGRDGEPSA